MYKDEIGCQDTTIFSLLIVILLTFGRIHSQSCPTSFAKSVKKEKGREILDMLRLRFVGLNINFVCYDYH